MALSTLGVAGTVAAGMMALGVGVGVAGLASADPTASPSASPSAGRSAGESGRDGTGFRRGGHHGRGGELVSALATKLGLSEDKVRDALQDVREEIRGTEPPADRADRESMRAQLAEQLAEKLGVDPAKVTAALEAVQAERRAEHAAALRERLDDAVADGTLTQQEADAVTKAVEKGVIHPRGAHR